VDVLCFAGMGSAAAECSSVLTGEAASAAMFSKEIWGGAPPSKGPGKQQGTEIMPLGLAEPAEVQLL
jgi:hypothetical protein